MSDLIDSFTKEDKVDRVKETLDAIHRTGDIICGSAENSTLLLLPILSQIALSLAVIADKYTEEDVERKQE